MLLALNDDQQMLADMASQFVKSRAPIARSRSLRKNHKLCGYDQDLWGEMSQLGWAGIPFPESLGGSGLGLAELVIVIEALGRTLAPEPFLSTILLGGLSVLEAGNTNQKEQLIPSICSGEVTLGFAHDEKHINGQSGHIETQAISTTNGYLITGRKIMVIDASTADHFLVSVQVDTDQTPSLFVVPANTPQLKVQAQGRVDSRNAAVVSFDGVHVPQEALVGERGKASNTIETALDRARVGLCAELVGLMSAVLDMTIEHLKTRVQFDVPLGSFQALQHRAAICFIELELSRSTMMAAARAMDEQSEIAPMLVSAAKVRCSDAAVLITGEALQMHGGIGMTDDCDVGMYLKRARAAALSFGDSAWHKERFASLLGF